MGVWADTPLARSAADAVLAEVFGGSKGQPYGELIMGEDSLLISDLIGLADDEGIPDLYIAAVMLKERIEPASLRSYVDTLAAGQKRREAERAQG